MWQFNFLLRKTKWLGLNKARGKYQGVKIIQVSVSLCLSESWENVVKVKFNSTRLPQDWKAGETTGDSDTDQRIFNKLKKKVNKL